MLKKYVVVRTYSAGVHVGVLVSHKGKEVVLRDARRLWQWLGAFTLSEVSQSGITGGRVSVPVPEIALTEAIEIIPCSKISEKSLREIKGYKP